MVVTPQLALRVAILGGDRAGAVRDRLLPALVPAGAVRRPATSRRRTTTACARSRSRRRAGRSSTATAPCWSTTAPRSSVQVRPSACRATDRRQARVVRRLGHALGIAAGDRAQAIRREVSASCRSARSRSRPTSALRTVFYLQENQTRVPGRGGRAGLPAPLPVRRDRRAPVRHDRRGDREAARSRPRYAGVALGDRVGQSGIEYTYDRYLRGRNGASRIQVDALGRPKGELAVRRPDARQAAAAVDRPRRAEGGPAGARSATASRARSSRWTRATARCSGSAATRASTRTCSPRASRQSVYKRLTDADNGAPLANRATRASTRRARRSS